MMPYGNLNICEVSLGFSTQIKEVPSSAGTILIASSIVSPAMGGRRRAAILTLEWAIVSDR